MGSKRGLPVVELTAYAQCAALVSGTWLPGMLGLSSSGGERPELTEERPSATLEILSDLGRKVRLPKIYKVSHCIKTLYI